MGRIYNSYINPLHFVKVNPVQIPQYLSRYSDQYLHANRLNEWQTATYFQPWMQSDAIKLQIQNNQGAVQIKLIDCHNKVVPGTTLNMTQKQRNKFFPEYFIYESSTALTNVPEGDYWMLKITSLTTEISEPIRVREEWRNSLLIQYRNYEYYQNIIFETGFAPNVRVQGLIQPKTMASNDTIFEEPELDAVMVQSIPYEIYELKVFGEEGGISDVMEKKLNRILGCSDISYDGKFFTKNIGAKWETTTDIKFRSLVGKKIELREQENRNSNIIDTDIDTNFEFSVMYIQDMKGYGDLSGQDSSQLVPVYDFE